MLEWMLLTIAIGTVGGLVLFRLRVPAGMMVGAIIAVAIFSVSTGHAYMPPGFKTFAQIVVGGYVGAGMSREELKKLPQVIKPYCLIMSIFFALNLVMGTIVYRLTSMDLLTALMCTMPGGLSDSPFIAMDIGADAVMVTIMQFARMIFGVSVLPFIIVGVDNFYAAREGRAPTKMQAGRRRSNSKGSKRGVTPVLIMLACTAVFGIIGKNADIPAGTFIFSMLGAMAVKFLYPKAYIPLWFRRVAQLFSGSVIGSQIVYSDIVEMRYLLLPIILVLSAYVINCIATGYLLHRLFGISKLESMFSVSPAGAVETSLIVADLGIESPNLIAIQLMRLTGVLAIFPQLFLLIVSAVG